MNERDKCDQCEGCGRIANTDRGEPWSQWEALPPGSDLAVKAGLVKPVECPKCNGMGVYDYPENGGI